MFSNLRNRSRSLRARLVAAILAVLTVAFLTVGVVVIVALQKALYNQIDGQLGSMCTVAFGSAFELTSRRAGELSNFLDMSDDLLTEPLEISGGELAVRPGAGLGVEIDADKLEHYRQDR